MSPSKLIGKSSPRDWNFNEELGKVLFLVEVPTPQGEICLSVTYTDGG